MRMVSTSTAPTTVLASIMKTLSSIRIQNGRTQPYWCGMAQTTAQTTAPSAALTTR